MDPPIALTLEALASAMVMAMVEAGMELLPVSVVPISTTGMIPTVTASWAVAPQSAAAGSATATD